MRDIKIDRKVMKSVILKSCTKREKNTSQDREVKVDSQILLNDMGRK